MREGPVSNSCWSLFERVMVVVQMCVGSGSNVGRYSFQWISLIHAFSQTHVDAERTRSIFRLNAFALLLNAVGFSFKCVWVLFDQIWLLIRTHLASCLNAFGFSSEYVWFLVRTYLASRSNVFGFLSKRVWLLVRTCLASRSSAFHLSFERVQAVFGTHSYMGRTRSNDKHTIPCV